MDGNTTIKYLQSYIKAKDYHPELLKDYFLKLAEETGELSRAIRKELRPGSDGNIKGTIDEELWDVIYYALAIANIYDIDMEKVIKLKSEMNEIKYPSDVRFEDASALKRRIYCAEDYADCIISDKNLQWEMDFLTLAAERYSVRKFKSMHLEQDKINKILKAGHLAPTGCNYQPQRILVLNTDESIRKLQNCTKCHFGALTAMLVCYNKDETWTRPYDGAKSAPVDAAIVTTHMMLEAHAIGVGSTWVMHFDPFAMREAFNIPGNIEPLALLVMGYPADDAEPLGLHSEFRPLEEVVVYESF